MNAGRFGCCDRRSHHVSAQWGEREGADLPLTHVCTTAPSSDAYNPSRGQSDGQPRFETGPVEHRGRWIGLPLDIETGTTVRPRAPPLPAKWMSTHQHSEQRSAHQPASRLAPKAEESEKLLPPASMTSKLSNVPRKHDWCRVKVFLA